MTALQAFAVDDRNCLHPIGLTSRLCQARLTSPALIAGQRAKEPVGDGSRGIARPRQEISGPAYQSRTLPSSEAESRRSSTVSNVKTVVRAHREYAQGLGKVIQASFLLHAHAVYWREELQYLGYGDRFGCPVAIVGAGQCELTTLLGMSLGGFGIVSREMWQIQR